MNTEYTVVAFMQNPWFMPGTHPQLIERYATEQRFHRVILSGTMSGKRLTRAFGSAFFRIWWDNANPQPVFSAEGSLPANLEHMRAVLRKINPRAVITFGRTAAIAMKSLSIEFPEIQQFNCPHPTARGLTREQLHLFAGNVTPYIHE